MEIQTPFDSQKVLSHVGYMRSCLKKETVFFFLAQIRAKEGTAKLVLHTSFLFFLLLGTESRHVVCRRVTSSPLQKSSFGMDGLPSFPHTALSSLICDPGEIHFGALHRITAAISCQGVFLGTTPKLRESTLSRSCSLAWRHLMS